MTLLILEKDERLVLQFWEHEHSSPPEGGVYISINPVLTKEIDITAHIERAVQGALADTMNAISDRLEDALAGAGSSALTSILKT